MQSSKSQSSNARYANPLCQPTMPTHKRCHDAHAPYTFYISITERKEDLQDRPPPKPSGSHMMHLSHPTRSELPKSHPKRQLKAPPRLTNSPRTRGLSLPTGLLVLGQVSVLPHPPPLSLGLLLPLLQPLKHPRRRALPRLQLPRHHR